MRPLEGRRILIVGASAGIGRGLALRSIKDGASVVVAARRLESLAKLVAEAGGGTALRCDLRSPQSCVAIAAEAAEVLGGIDVIVVSSGAAPLKRVAGVTVEDWDLVFETNVIGVHQMLTAALPLLNPGALVAVLSSESVGQARNGLAPYSASKAALDQLMLSFRAEHPAVRFSTVVVGGTYPTEFGDAFEATLLGEVMNEWIAAGQFPSELMPTDDVVDSLHGVLTAIYPNPSVGMETIVLRSPTPPLVAG